MTDTTEAGHPVGPEIDDTSNPTDAAPAENSRVQAMLVQLQAMIDQAAVTAGPVLRQVAVKAAELAAVAGERAGPLAYKAAEKTQDIGQKVAARSKEVAADLRRQADGSETSVEMDAEPGMSAESAPTWSTAELSGDQEKEWPAADRREAGDSQES